MLVQHCTSNCGVVAPVTHLLQAALILILLCTPRAQDIRGPLRSRHIACLTLQVYLWACHGSAGSSCFLLNISSRRGIVSCF